MTVDNNNSNVWNVTFIFLYSTELLCLNLKTNLSNTVVCTAVWQCDYKDRLDQNQKNKNNNNNKKKKQDEVVPAPHGERRVMLDTMLKIEDAAGVNLPTVTGKFKTRKINADKAKKVYA